MNLNLCAIASISLSFCCLLLAVFIRHYARSQTHRVWALFNLVVALWGFGNFLAAISPTPGPAMLNWRLCYIPGTYISVVFYHLICSWCEIKRPKFKLFAKTFGVVFMPLLFTSWFIDSDSYYLAFGSIWYNKAALGFSVWFGFWAVIVFFSFLELWWYCWTVKGLRRTQSLILFWGMALGFMGGSSSIIPCYGLRVYPAFHFSICIYSGIMTYAIFRHQMLDIRLVIKKGIMYSILITSIMVFYLTSVRALEQIFQNLLGYKSFAGSVSITLVIAIIFNPLKNRIQGFVDRTFFRGTTAEIAAQNERLRDQVTQSERYQTLAGFTKDIIDAIQKPIGVLMASDRQLEERGGELGFIKDYAVQEREQIEKIDSLLEHLTSYSHPAEGISQRINMVKLINETLGMLRPQLNEKEILVRTDFQSPEDVQLNVDPSQLRQALFNIFMNAIEAMGSGGKIFIKTEKTETHLRIMVKDTGEGIAKEDMARIFDPFFSKKQGHAGLGLSAARGIIESCRGKILVKSDVGFGTDLIIDLPLE